MTNLLGGSAQWHGGVLRLAEHMEGKVAESIAGMRWDDRSIEALLLTGHSLGGGTSQVFYAACFTQGIRMAQATRDRLTQHCYTVTRSIHLGQVLTKFTALPSEHFPNQGASWTLSTKATL